MTNPFKYGPIALDESFTDRDAEVAELATDALNGQDVVIFAPRRYGKTSLVHRVAQQLTRRRALVAEVNLWFTPTKEKLAGRLAREVADILGVAGRAKEIARAFAGLRITPTITVDPNDGSFSFSFAAGHTSQDVDDTLEHLLRMLAETRGARKRAGCPGADARGDRGRQEAAGRPDHGRVPGDRRDRRRADEAAALGVPGAAGGLA